MPFPIFTFDSFSHIIKQCFKPTVPVCLTYALDWPFKCPLKAPSHNSFFKHVSQSSFQRSFRSPFRIIFRLRFRSVNYVSIFLSKSLSTSLNMLVNTLFILLWSLDTVSRCRVNYMSNCPFAIFVLQASSSKSLCKAPCEIPFSTFVVELPFKMFSSSVKHTLKNWIRNDH